jgi:hypothetical protein
MAQGVSEAHPTATSRYPVGPAATRVSGARVCFADFADFDTPLGKTLRSGFNEAQRTRGPYCGACRLNVDGKRCRSSAAVPISRVLYVFSQ